MISPFPLSPSPHPPPAHGNLFIQEVKATQRHSVDLPAFAFHSFTMNSTVIPGEGSCLKITRASIYWVFIMYLVSSWALCLYDLIGSLPWSHSTVITQQVITKGSVKSFYRRGTGAQTGFQPVQGTKISSGLGQSPDLSDWNLHEASLGIRLLLYP